MIMRDYKHKRTRYESVDPAFAFTFGIIIGMIVTATLIGWQLL